MFAKRQQLRSIRIKDGELTFAQRTDYDNRKPRIVPMTTTFWGQKMSNWNCQTDF